MSAEQNRKGKYIALVVGASGLVGRALLEEFRPHYETFGTYCHRTVPGLMHLDLRDAIEVRSVLMQVRPEVVLCPAAQPNVELCEAEPDATREINVAGLRNLLAVLSEIGAALVYFSSEYVFDGMNGPYSENDSCSPLNEYGRQKLECERMIAAQIERYVIARISGVYDWETNGKNFVVRLIETLGSGRKIQVPFDQVVTPTYAPSLARAVRRLVEQRLWGTYHLSGPVAMPRTEFAHLIAKTFSLDESLIVPAETSELNLRAIRPCSAGLKIDKSKTVIEVPAGPAEGLRIMRERREHKFQTGQSTATPQKGEESTVL